MEAPFDIAADLDTPVSAYLKLQALKPRFLLESVEGGERLARYSFLGLGEAVRLIVESDRVLQLAQVDRTEVHRTPVALLQVVGAVHQAFEVNAVAAGRSSQRRQLQMRRRR